MDLDVENVVASDADELSFLDKVRQFKRKADEMFTVFSRLREKRDIAYSTPETRASYDRVMGNAEGLMSKVQDYVPQIDAVLSWGGGLFGLSRNQTLGQLGIAPLLLFGIGALITTMTVWISDAWTEYQKLTAIEKYLGQGLSATEAGKLARGEAGAGWLTDIVGGGLGGGIALALVAGGAIFMLMRQGRK
jgi:hypothetical protein